MGCLIAAASLAGALLPICRAMNESHCAEENSVNRTAVAAEVGPFVRVTQWLRSNLRSPKDFTAVLNFVENEMADSKLEKSADAAKSELASNLWKALTTWNETLCYVPDPRVGLSTHSQEHSTFWNETDARYRTMRNMVGKMVRTMEPMDVLAVIANVCYQHHLRMACVKQLEASLDSGGTGDEWFAIVKETATKLHDVHLTNMRLLKHPRIESRVFQEQASAGDDATVGAAMLRPTEVSDLLPGVPSLGKVMEEYLHVAKKEATEEGLDLSGQSEDYEEAEKQNFRQLAASRKNSLDALIRRMEETLKDANHLPMKFDAGERSDELQLLQMWESFKVDLRNLRRQKEELKSLSKEMSEKKNVSRK